MAQEGDQLAVRKHDRKHCDLGGWLRVDDPHREQIVLSRAVAERNGRIPVRIVDCSQGGVGLRSSVYLPRGTRVIVGFGGAINGKAHTHELRLRVQRGSMIDRTPAYYLGTSISAPSESAVAIANLRALSETESSNTERVA